VRLTATTKKVVHERTFPSVKRFRGRVSVNIFSRNHRRYGDYVRRQIDHPTTDDLWNRPSCAYHGLHQIMRIHRNMFRSSHFSAIVVSVGYRSKCFVKFLVSGEMLVNVRIRGGWSCSVVFELRRSNRNRRLSKEFFYRKRVSWKKCIGCPIVYRNKSLSKQEFIETRVYRNKSLSEKSFPECIYVEEPLSQQTEETVISRMKECRNTIGSIIARRIA